MIFPITLEKSCVKINISPVRNIFSALAKDRNHFRAVENRLPP